MWLAGVSVRVCVCGKRVSVTGSLLDRLQAQAASACLLYLLEGKVRAVAGVRCTYPQQHVLARVRIPVNTAMQRRCKFENKNLFSNFPQNKKKKNPIQNANARQWPESPGARTRGRLDGAMRAGRPGSGAHSADVCKCTFMIDANPSPTRAAPRKIHKTQVVPPRISSQRGR
jgi:hypothetical protein